MRVAALPALLALGLAVVATSPVVAAPVGAISGMVRNVTTAAPAAGVPVQLVFIGAQGAEPVAQSLSDAAGRASFAGLADGRYLVTARYQGVSYAAHAVVTDGAKVDVAVKVYDASSNVPLRASLLGLVVDVMPGYVRVSEFIHLHNPTARTFLGDVVLPLPKDARYVTYAEGFHQPRVEAAGIKDRLVVRPGGHQVAYQYFVGGEGQVVLDRRLTVPVDRVEMLVAAPAEARSPRLRALPAAPHEETGRTYTRASGRAVPSGDFSVAVTGVPSVGLWRAPVAAGLLAACLAIGLMWAIARVSSDS